jgi:hypothetical protein
MPRLEIHRDGRVLVYDILEDELSIGRHESNAVRVDEDGVAGVHARLVRDGKSFRVQDLCMDGRVRVNGVQTGDHALQSGDSIEVADAVRIVFFADGDGAMDPVGGEATGAGTERAAPARSPASKPVSGGESPTPPPAPTATPTPVVSRRRGGGAAGGAQRPRSGAPKRGGAPAAIAKTTAAGVRVRPRSGASSGARGADGDAPQPRPRRRNAPPGWVLGILAAPVIGILVMLVMLMLKEEGRTTAEWLAMAREQYAQRDLEHALGSLEMAASRQPTGSLKRELDELRIELNKAVARRAQRIDYERAVTARARVLQFERTYLHDRDGGRPAARELLQEIAAWNDEYRDLCMRIEGGSEIVESVDRIEAAWRDVAAPDEPDTAQDVEFRIQRRTYMRPRRDREALALLAEAEAKGTLSAARASELRREILSDAEGMRDARLEAIERMWGRDQRDRALEELRFLVEEGLPETLVEPARALLAEYERQLAAQQESDSR